MGNHVPNFDAMPKEDIAQWYKQQTPNRSELAVHMFPGRPAGYVMAYNNLITYATLKYRAMSARESGRIEEALGFEGNCDMLYQQLPEFARW
jgi:hypothetical protein